MNRPKIDAIFPTCIYSNTLDTRMFDSDIDRVIDRYMFDRTDGIQGEYLGLADMHQEAVLQKFYTTIMDNIRIYTDVLGLDNSLFDFYMVKSCLSKHTQDTDVMNRHVHNCSDISFVYYHQVPENSAALMFHSGHHNNELFGGLFARERERSMLTANNAFNSTEWYMEPAAGLLVIFPSNLGHSTRKLSEGMFSGERIAIVGDVNLVLKPGQDNWETGKVSLDKWIAF
jgi:hypothetical protein